MQNAVSQYCSYQSWKLMPASRDTMVDMAGHAAVVRPVQARSRINPLYGSNVNRQEQDNRQ